MGGKTPARAEKISIWLVRAAVVHATAGSRTVRKKQTVKRRTIIILIVLVVLATAGFFGYRSFQRRAEAAAQSQYQTATIEYGSLTAMVGATGTVRADQTAVIAWESTGQVEDVLVSVGDLVEDGQILAELKKSSLPQNIILAEAELYSARQALEDLQDYELAAAQAQVALTEAIDALEQANKQRTSKDYRRASDETLETAKANYLLAESEVDKYEQNYDMVDHLPEDNLERLNALTMWMGARQQRDKALANYNYLLSSPDSEEVAAADANVVLAEAQLEAAQLEYERIKDGPSEDEIAAAEARIAAAEATLSLARLEAPFAGTVTEVNVQPGDQVAPGASSFRIDDLSRLLVDVQIPEVDINRVAIGQQARLTFDAILGKEYTGEVVSVAKVGTDVQGAINFKVTIEMTDADEAVLPAMTSAVNMVVDQLDNVLTVPNRAVRLQDGQRTIYLLRNGQLVPVRVEIGAISDTHSEILSGDVKAGDVVVLNPPMQFGPGSGGFGM